MSKSNNESYWQKLSLSLAPVILTSITSFTITYATLLANQKIEPIKLKIFSISKELQIALMTGIIILLLFLTLNSIRKSIVRYNDSRQEPFSGILTYSHGRYKKEGTIDDFLFEIEFSVQPNVYINIVEGPFCTGKNEDKCGSELVEEKTLFGNYKYRCERCGKVQKSKLSSWSLQKRAERIATAEIKKEKKTGVFNDDFRRY